LENKKEFAEFLIKISEFLTSLPLRRCYHQLLTRRGGVMMIATITRMGTVPARNDGETENDKKSRPADGVGAGLECTDFLPPTASRRPAPCGCRAQSADAHCYKNAAISQ
jgi:hypothetical protein